MSNQLHFGFVVEYVQDMQAARHFYEDVLGLRAERVHPTFVQFNHFAIASDEPMVGNGAPEIYWFADDAERAFQELSGTAHIILPPADAVRDGVRRRRPRWATAIRVGAGR